MNISSIAATGRASLGPPVEWRDFYVVNALVVVLGVVAANLAGSQPAIAPGFPALTLINATFFHVAPFIRQKGRFSPGLFTAVAPRIKHRPYFRQDR